ncbi:DUF1707 domain-containing protein [Actinoplanes sp. NPDC049802]|uniref:DUF1707 SHOCT-like domain-containing protein n=1 Tax=Actinoplanes sp. NPDC049802 TaxID=3154742 RepID=UPI0033E1986F
MTAVRRAGLRIGVPERELARAALQEHLAAERIDAAEFEQRLLDCQNARTRAALQEVFADLPDPRPELAVPAGEEDDDAAGVTTATVAVFLGLPVSIAMGFIYGAWWTLAVTAAVAVAIVAVGQTWAALRR